MNDKKGTLFVMDLDMSAIHTCSFPLHVNALRIEAAVWRSLVCQPLAKNTPAVWDITDVKAEPLSLIGHTKAVSALCFSHDEPVLLCSAADDYVIVWNIRKCQHDFAKQLKVTGNVVVVRPGTTTYISFSLDAEHIALCVDSVVKIASVSKAKIVAELASHQAKVTAAEFCPHYIGTLVSISDDRTFKVWNVQDVSVLYHSQIITSSPLISISMNKAEPHVAVGSAGGVVKVFDLTDGNNFRQLFQLDIGKHLAKAHRTQNQETQKKQFFPDTSAVSSHSGTSRQRTVSDTFSKRGCQFHQDRRTIGAISMASTGLVNSQQLLTVVGTLFESQVHAIQWKIPSSYDSSVAKQSVINTIHNQSPGDLFQDQLNSASSLDDALSMVAKTPLLEDSPLKIELVPKGETTRNGLSASRQSTLNKKKKPDPMNQPLTFKSSIKSSGYFQSPCRTMFKPKINNSQKSKDAERHPTGRSQFCVQEYPSDAGPPREIEEKLNVSAIPTAIRSLKFSPSGKGLACSLTNMSMLVFHIPYGQKESSIFVGHEGAVNTVHWSNCGKFLITASNDKSAIVWDRRSGEVLLQLSTFSHNFKETQSSGKSKDATAFLKEVKGAQFFYMDKFILLIVCNCLCLYKYHLDGSKDDIKRYQVKSKYKLVKQWESPSQNLTALAAVNSFYSHLALCAGSNRDVEIFDLNIGQQSHVFSDVHVKPVHSIGLNEGSTFTSQPLDAFNVFATSSIMDCIKLWDVRTKGSVMRLEGHANNAHGCGLSFSPCGTFLGSGSEDKIVYVYDLRSGTYCQRLRGHSDVVSAVAFNPGWPLMAAGSTDGKIFLYKT
ncbi:hypothetical protein C0Q70_12268 [Pomacea canaliculata]|uniref:Anaphase-promoting complex subunit 4 WD40 domain-containing protein n=1 Tax=Pomacea canaliculata TaxID=400727 RepID=A0A2T7P118_POMCA|nr:hypothetical protein C0Q70_12268 [Pomacea canaliculata]